MMACSLCLPADADCAEVPFRPDRTVANDGHQVVSLNVCVGCGQPALYFSIDLYDDTWGYWCAVSKTELELLTTPQHEDKLFDIARSVVRSKNVLQRHPDGFLRWIPGKSFLLDGPPW